MPAWEFGPEGLQDLLSMAWGQAETWGGDLGWAACCALGQSLLGWVLSSISTPLPGAPSDLVWKHRQEKRPRDFY